MDALEETSKRQSLILDRESDLIDQDFLELEYLLCVSLSIRGLKHSASMLTSALTRIADACDSGDSDKITKETRWARHILKTYGS